MSDFFPADSAMALSPALVWGCRAMVSPMP